MEENAEQQSTQLQQQLQQTPEQQQPQEPEQQQDKATSRPFRRVLVITALVVFTLACNVILTRVMLAHTTPRVVAFDMKKTLDSFMDSVSQKPLTEAQSKALSDRFNDALEKSLADYQQQHHVLILVSPAVVQGASDVTRTIQHDIARRMKGERE
ncbi:type-F conjugative transfer system protein TrbI [Klebsiella grimontii]|uniref:type-F conjugative transfer system protein TrbI n=1 Tax=Klebsiella grimontii TaxID=2058152 RepID=UPI00300D4EA8